MIKQILIKTGQFLAVALAIPIILFGMVLTVSLANAAQPAPDKQVYCNKEGNSKWKAQISNGEPNEHEYKLDGVFVQNQSQVTEQMDTRCQELYGDDEEPVLPKECPAGTTLVDYENGDKQKPICKGEPTGCPYGDSIPIDSPKCVAPYEEEIPEYIPTSDGGMKDPVTGEVFYGK